jgi:hypothetical protein
MVPATAPAKMLAAFAIQNVLSSFCLSTEHFANNKQAWKTLAALLVIRFE